MLRTIAAKYWSCDGLATCCTTPSGMADILHRDVSSAVRWLRWIDSSTLVVTR